MSAIRVTIRGDRHLTERVRRKIESKRLRVRDELTDIIRSIRSSWMRRVRVNTGTLQRSSQVEPVLFGRGRLVITAPYASEEEHGTAPHVITARPGGVLRWIGRDGEVHFAKRVNHPGTRGSHALRESVAANRRTLRPRIQRVLKIKT